MGPDAGAGHWIPCIAASSARHSAGSLHAVGALAGRVGRVEPLRLAQARAVFARSVFAWMALGAAMVLPVPATAEIHEVTVQRNLAAKMRDGVSLRADVYRPKEEGKFPVLLVRTPYDKRNETNFGLKGAARGFVVIAQDVRGRFESEGEWYTFMHESQDGYDTVEWAAGLPYSNGKVGMFGGSYVGATQFVAALAKPPHRG